MAKLIQPVDPAGEGLTWPGAAHRTGCHRRLVGTELHQAPVPSPTLFSAALHALTIATPGEGEGEQGPTLSTDLEKVPECPPRSLCSSRCTSELPDPGSQAALQSAMYRGQGLKRCPSQLPPAFLLWEVQLLTQ